MLIWEPNPFHKLPYLFIQGLREDSAAIESPRSCGEAKSFGSGIRREVNPALFYLFGGWP